MGIIKFRARFIFQAIVPHILYYAYDGYRRAVWPRRHDDPFAKRVFIRKETLRQRFIDNHHRRRVQIILAAKTASPQERNLHGSEVVGGCDAEIGEVTLTPSVGRPFNRKWSAAHIPAERQRRHPANQLDTG